MVFFFVSNIGAQQNVILLTSLPGGSEGDSFYNDTSVIKINSSGVVSYNNSTASDDWGITASNVTYTGAYNSTFAITTGSMSLVNMVDGNDLGDMIAPGGIDRDSTGKLGVRGNTNGIDVNEGLYFGLDLTNLSSTVSVQIKKIHIAFASGSTETGVIVSRVNTSKKIVFGLGTTPGVDYPLTNGTGAVDVSSFNLYLTGGRNNNEMISVFNNSSSANNFRITDIEIEILNNNLDLSVVESKPHPRILLEQGEESSINSLINQSQKFSNLHNYIIEECDAILLESPLVYNVQSGRILNISREAIRQIYFLSYGYRMTNNAQYLAKAQEVINTVCDFPDWITYSLDTAEMCFAVAIGYDWLYNDITESTRQNARDAILNYAFKTQKSKAFWDMNSNWNQVCIGGLAYGALAIYGDGTAEMDTEAAYVLNRILVKNPNSMNYYAGGNYPEGPTYWGYGTTYEVLMLSALEGIYGPNHEGLNRLIHSPGFLESLKYMQYVTGTSSLFFNYSDSTEKRNPAPASFWMANKYNDPSSLYLENEMLENGYYFRNFEEERFLPAALIYARNTNLNNVIQPSGKTWTGNGVQPVVLVRTAWEGSTGKYMGVKSGTPNFSHGQMDGGSFVYDSQGMRWAMDFGKYDYTAVNNGIGNAETNDFTQSSLRWDIFRVSNLNHNTVSIKKSSESTWQHHKADGKAVIEEVYDTSQKRGSKINMLGLVGLNNELNAISRSIYVENDASLKIEDYISNGVQSVDVYWNMVTRALVETVNSNTLKLTQGGKTVFLQVQSSNPEVNISLASNRSTDPVTYFPSATYERKNPGTVMVGFEATVPANTTVTFTVTLTDGPEVPPSLAQPINYILLDLPTPLTALEGNFKYFDESFFYVDSQGKVSIAGYATEYAWSVYGETDIDDFLNSSFSFRWDAMGSTNTNSGNGFGALLSVAGIDRAANGELGVRGSDSNAIDPNEGYRLGLNLSKVPATVTLQLVKIEFSTIGGQDAGYVVNRNDTSKKLFFGATGVPADVNIGNGYLNVENLDISLQGGETDVDLASVFNSGASGNFRVARFIFKIIGLPTLNTSLPTHKKETIVAYPNPFSDTITIHSTEHNGSNLRVKIFNLSGSCLLDKSHTQDIHNKDLTINLSNLSSGMYLLQISDGIELMTKKIIKD